MMETQFYRDLGRKPRIYLAGPINGKSDEECKGWREEAKKLLDADFLDPMARDYRGVEMMNVCEIVEGDKADIESVNFVLCNAASASWGTAMELHFAHSIGKKVFAFNGGKTASPWLVYHSQWVVTTLKEACKRIAEQERMP